VKAKENDYKSLGFGGHFVHFCNGLSPIFMYKYVKGFWGKRGFDK
jgi:hypothetical protein